jgi:hypothetical protein
LGTIPYPGGFTAWHDPPVVTLPPGSRIHDGQKVHLDYYHTAIIYEEQVMWNSEPAQRTDSLEHFASLGHRQILAGYYDGPVGAIRDWLRDGREVPGISGAMYTTWQHQYRDLEAFAAQLGQHGAVRP